jgi:hypothetical protein
MESDRDWDRGRMRSDLCFESGSRVKMMHSAWRFGDSQI